MKTCNIAMLAAVAAASAPTNGTTLTIRSTTNSKIKTGNAVFAGYCQGDVAPTFNFIDLDAARLHPDGASLMSGSDNTITLNVLNVKASCLGNYGVSVSVSVLSGQRRAAQHAVRDAAPKATRTTATVRVRRERPWATKWPNPNT